MAPTRRLRCRYVTRDDVANVRRLLDAGSWRLHPDEAQSIEQHYEQQKDNVFIYQRQQAEPVPGKEGSVLEGTPFILGLMTPTMRQWAIQHGNGRPLLVDSTFGTNHLMVSAHGLACGFMTHWVTVHRNRITPE